jgi:hypothetical protein
MDNFSIRVCATGRGSLWNAIQLAFAHNCPGGKVTHYALVGMRERTEYRKRGDDRMEHSTVWMLDESGLGRTTLVLLWGDETPSSPPQNKVQKLPYPLALEQCVDFCKGWLDVQELTNEPDHDGDNGRGFHLFVGPWKQLGPYSYSIFGLQAIWAMYGK